MVQPIFSEVLHPESPEPESPDGARLFTKRVSAVCLSLVRDSGQANEEAERDCPREGSRRDPFCELASARLEQAKPD